MTEGLDLPQVEVQRVNGVIASYARLYPGEVTRTVEAAEDIHVDVDADGRPLGVEVTGGADWQRGLTALAVAGRLRVVPESKSQPQLEFPGS